MDNFVLWSCELENGKSVNADAADYSSLTVKQAVLVLAGGAKADSNSACTVWASTDNEDSEQLKFAVCVLRPMICENVSLSFLVPAEEKMEFSISGGPKGAKVFLSGYTQLFLDDDDDDDFDEELDIVDHLKESGSLAEEEESESEEVEKHAASNLKPEPIAIKENTKIAVPKKNNRPAKQVVEKIEASEVAKPAETVAVTNTKPNDKQVKGKPVKVNLPVATSVSPALKAEKQNDVMKVKAVKPIPAKHSIPTSESKLVPEQTGVKRPIPIESKPAVEQAGNGPVPMSGKKKRNKKQKKNE